VENSLWAFIGTEWPDGFVNSPPPLLSCHKKYANSIVFQKPPTASSGIRRHYQEDFDKCSTEGIAGWILNGEELGGAANALGRAAKRCICNILKTQIPIGHDG